MKPFIYTMPEKFMSDESVPIKWRLYGYINGFWIGGKPVYATNDHFAEKFKCSERHISRALAELEADGLLLRNITGLSRYILPGGMTPEVRGGRPGVSEGGDVGGQHISVNSTSDNIYTAKAEKNYTIEDQPKTNRKPPDQNSVLIRKEMEAKLGRKFPNPIVQQAAIVRMIEAGYTKKQIIDEYNWALKDKYWSTKGVDFKVIANIIHKEHD